jgi:hypothetical protein
MMPAGNVQIVLSVNQANYTKAMSEAQRQLDTFAGKAKGAGHSTVSSMQAASASIRLMENPLGNNIRAIERLISQSTVLSGVMKAAFPVVGLVAGGMIVGKLIADVSKFVETAQKMPKALSDGFAALHLQAQSSNDALKLVNDQLQNNIDKLQGKPQNNLAIAIDEARIKADDLAKSLENDMTKVKALLEQNKLGVLDGLLTGQGRTGSTAGSVNSYFQQISDLGAANNHAVHQYGADSPQAAKAFAAIDAKQKSFAAWLDRRMAVLNNPDLAKGDELEAIGGFGDQSANKSIVSGAQDILTDSQDEQADKAKNAQLTTQNKAAEAAKAATEQAKVAADKLVADMQAALDAMKLQQNMSLKAVYDYWDGMKAGELAGSTAYNDMTKKQSEIAVEAATKAHEQITKAIADQKRNSADDSVTGPEIINRYAEASQRNAIMAGGEQDQTGMDSNALSIDNARNDAREKETQVTDAAGKSMSRYAASLQLATIHGQELAVVMAALQSDLSIKQNRFNLDPTKENGKAVSDAQVALANAGAAGQVQATQDQQTSPTSGLVGFQDGINQFIQASQDMAAAMRDLTLNALHGFNDTLIQIMSTPHMTGLKARTELGNYGAGLARSAAGTGLQSAEGEGLTALGLKNGQLGTKGNPMMVRDVDAKGPAGLPGSSGSGLIGRLNDSKFASGLFGGKVFGPGGFLGGAATGTSTSPAGALADAMSTSDGMAATDAAAGGLATDSSDLTSMIPFMANGGSIAGPAVVGDHGPELFIPSGAGTIIPNHKLTNYAGAMGNGGHTFNIDASNSTDPAQTRAQVMRGIRQAAPQIVASSMQTSRDQARRRPTPSR